MVVVFYEVKDEDHEWISNEVRNESNGGDEGYCTPVYITLSSRSTSLVYFGVSELAKK